ncbi:hypothetical protein [Sedimentitalea todarodis]|uniref:DUF3035 domain-containing protein n=1 Tax=Sedimentitalea todarodis TaxID=1631240 RepID=A0ABU3VBH1_9RHOB|nr:hypothetical protein [Sedimentitalea todarodis]MDU9003522.1 hypothetical protein [Sedimentitalea todarodis]
MSSQSRGPKAWVRVIGPLLLLAACAQIPQLDGTVPARLESADYPALAPIETLLVPLPDPQERSEDVRQGLEGRRDALRDRARRLNGVAVVDEETEARMRVGVES